MADRMIRACFVIGCFCVASVVLGQSSSPSDPTRPPIGVQSVEAPVPGESAKPVSLILQSILRPREGKPSALIGGQIVVLGGMVGERRLIALSEKEAVLKGPDGIERLSLTPSVEKTDVPEKTTATTRAQSKGKP